MKYLLIILIVYLVVICKWMRKKENQLLDIKTVDREILDKLEVSERYAYSTEKRENLRGANKKGIIAKAIFLFIITMVIMLGAFMHEPDYILVYLFVGVVIYSFGIIVMFINKRAGDDLYSDEQKLYVIKCYVKMENTYKNGSYYIIVYYDYIQKKHIICNELACIKMNVGEYEEIVVKERGDRLSVVSVKKRMDKEIRR